MNGSVNVTIRLDRDVKENAEELFHALGMSFSTAVNVFARQAIRHGGIPFNVSDQFYSEKNQARLYRSMADAEAGKVTAHELIED